MAQYHEVAAALRARITDGEFPLGAQLPSIAEIQTEYGVRSLNTVRQAQQLLVDEGLIETRRGIGAFVTRTEPLHAWNVLAELADVRDRLNHVIAALAKQAPMPPAVREHVMAALAFREADRAIRDFAARRGAFRHVGDPFGEVLTWVWRDSHDAAIELLVLYLTQLREHPQAPQPPIRLDDVLEALRFSDLSDDEYTALCDRARVDVPRMWGTGNPND